MIHDDLVYHIIKVMQRIIRLHSLLLIPSYSERAVGLEHPGP